MMFLCGPAHHIAVRLSFLRSKGKLRSLQGLTPRLFEVRGWGRRQISNNIVPLLK